MYTMFLMLCMASTRYYLLIKNSLSNSMYQHHNWSSMSHLLLEFLKILNLTDSYTVTHWKANLKWVANIGPLSKIQSKHQTQQTFSLCDNPAITPTDTLSLLLENELLLVLENLPSVPFLSLTLNLANAVNIF